MAYQMAGSAYRTKSYNRPQTQKPTVSVQIQVPSHMNEAHAWLMKYNGMFNLLLDLRSKLLKYGQLSDKQWGAIDRCKRREELTKKAADPTTILVDSCHVPIVVSPTSARYIAKVHKWPMNPCTLTVTQIKSVDHRGMTLRVKPDWDSNVSVCRCCAKSLTDWRSQATGVGPICVRGTGISYVRNQADVARFQQEIKQLATSMGEVEVYIKKWHLKEGMNGLNHLIQNATPSKIELPAVSEDHIIPFQHFDWNPTLRVLSIPSFKIPFFTPIMNEMPLIIGVRSSRTGTVATFFLHTAVRTDGIMLYTSTGLEDPIKVEIKVK